MVSINRNTRRRGPIEIGGQDAALLGNQVNAWDGSISVNRYGMSHNTRISYDEELTTDKTYSIWEDLGRPIYFEVSITATGFFQVTLLGEKDWADQTDLDRTQAAILCIPNEELFIYDEEFTRIFVEICDEPGCNPTISIFASGFIPDNRGVNQYRGRIDMDVKP